MSQLDEMREQICKIFKEYDKQGTKTWTADIAVSDMQYQIGSLTKRILQLRGFRYKEGLSEAEIRESIGDELADIMAEVLFTASELGISMEEAWEKMAKSDNVKIKERSNKR